MKRLLLTGAGGFVGHHTLEHFLANTDWQIVATDSFRHQGKTDRIREVLDVRPEWQERVDVVTHDLTVPFSQQLAHRVGDVDYIVNMASESHVDRSIEDPVPFVRNNVDLALNTLELARTLQPETYIAVSTDEVYGPMAHGLPHSEWCSIVPSNPYAASKAAQEAITTSYWRTYDVPAVITNTMNIVGERQSPEKYLPMLISKILTGETVTVHGTPEDIGSRFYLHARNQADALLFLLERRAGRFTDGDMRPDRFNVVGERQISNLELAELVAEILGKNLDYELVDFHSTRPGHDPHYGLDDTKLSALGWKPPVSLEESLEKTIGWTLEHPEWLLQ